MQRAQHFQPGKHAERAVELASGRLGVEMRAHRDRRRRGVLALAAREHGADLVHRDGAAERLALLAEPVAHAPVLVGQGQPANAAFRRAADLGRVHQRVPEPLRIDLQIGDHGVTSARATPRGALDGAPGRVGHMGRGKRRPRDIAAIAGRGAHLARPPGELAVGDGRDRRAVADAAFEHVVFDPADLVLRRDRLGRRRVEDHEVRVRADRDRALARIDVEDAGDVGRGHGDELLARQPAGGHARAPEHRHAVLQSARTVRDDAEIIAPEALLRVGEGAVVGRDHLQRAALQSGPERLLVRLGRGTAATSRAAPRGPSRR